MVSKQFLDSLGVKAAADEPVIEREVRRVEAVAKYPVKRPAPVQPPVPEGQMIKAIETHWNGYRFRSRLEARWAVFFDTLGIRYQYEPDTYDLGELGWYLPDFWFPDAYLWAEIKPGLFTNEEWKKARSLELATGFPVIQLIGAPDFRAYQTTHNPPDCKLCMGDGTCDFEGGFLLYPSVGNLDYKGVFTLCPDLHYAVPDCDRSYPEAYRKAVYAARSARFGAHE